MDDSRGLGDEPGPRLHFGERAAARERGAEVAEHAAEDAGDNGRPGRDWVDLGASDALDAHACGFVIRDGATAKKNAKLNASPLSMVAGSVHPSTCGLKAVSVNLYLGTLSLGIT